MSEIGEMWNDHKAIMKVKKAKNEVDSTKLLEAKGICFDSKNFGNHLIIHPYGLQLTEKKEIIDFWPSTGTWMGRNGKQGRGVRNLLKHIRKGE